MAGETPGKLTYVVAASNHPGLKIGSTYNLNHRLSKLPCSAANNPSSVCWREHCPNLIGLRLVKAYMGGDDLERALHFIFKRRKLHGEWFAVSSDEVDQAVKLYMG